MSAVGTAVSPSISSPPPGPLPALLFPPARPIGVVSDKIYPYFIANAAATDVPTHVFELIIRFPFVAHRAPFLHARNTIGENNSRRNGHYVIACYLAHAILFCYLLDNSEGHTGRKNVNLLRT